MPLRLLRVGLISAAVTIASVPGVAADEPPTGWNEETGIYEMVFPVDGETYYDDSFGACRGSRCRRSHEGTDILADKMTPVVAVAAGTVVVMRDGARRCCDLAIEHDDGWTTWYVHLNNDTPGTDDGRGWGFAPGMEVGVRVDAGQVIGYVGDSGNAETTPPHLHFELIDPEGSEINPYPHLRSAEERIVEAVDDAVEPLADATVWEAWISVP